MINAIVSKFISPCQIDFPDSVARSIKGAIHFKPGATVSMTEEEFEYLKDKYSELAKSLKVSVKKKVLKKSPEAFSMDDVKIEVDKDVFSHQLLNFDSEDTRKIGRKKRKKKDKSIESEGKTSSD